MSLIKCEYFISPTSLTDRVLPLYQVMCMLIHSQWSGEITGTDRVHTMQMDRSCAVVVVRSLGPQQQQEVTLIGSNIDTCLLYLMPRWNQSHMLCSHTVIVVNMVWLFYGHKQLEDGRYGRYGSRRQRALWKAVPWEWSFFDRFSVCFMPVQLIWLNGQN